MLSDMSLADANETVAINNIIKHNATTVCLMLIILPLLHWFKFHVNLGVGIIYYKIIPIYMLFLYQKLKIIKNILASMNLMWTVFKINELRKGIILKMPKNA